ncbi:MAG: hypothetical protein KAG53_03610, partial [Endozoicomonadaceae bacterium]|nr:hypothetical protein [Endozoicomonadaceae bacterium]
SSSSSSGSGYDADYDSDLPTKDVRIKKKLLMSKKERRFNIIRNGVVGNIINIKDYLASQLTSNSQADVDARQQGVILNDKFYFQKALGHGNCFYLAYLTGWLHYIVAHNTIDETIKMLENQKAYRKDVQRRNAIDYTDFLIGMLQKLKENPSLEMIGSILSNSDIANKIAMYLRDFAVFGVANSVEQILVHQDRSKEYIRLPLGKTPDPADTTWRYIWDHTTLIGFTENEKEDSPPTGGILDDNEALCEAMLKEGEELSRETYCKVQRKNGIHVQRPEIGILNDYFVPITLYQRMDIPQNEGRGSRPDGRLDGYGSDNVINLFRSPEHFDALIPKDVIAKTKASLSKKI